MADHGYRFVLRTPRAQLLLGFAGAAVCGLVAGILLSAALLADGAVFPGAGRLRWPLLALSVPLAATCAVAFRRAYVRATDLRIGETGIYVKTLRGERYVAWPDVFRATLDGRRLRVLFRSGASAFEEVCAYVPDDDACFRIAAFLRDHEARMQARTQPTGSLVA